MGDNQSQEYLSLQPSSAVEHYMQIIRIVARRSGGGTQPTQPSSKTPADTETKSGRVTLAKPIG